MKLKTFDATDKNIRSTRPFLTVYEIGYITFNKAAVNELKLNNKVHITIHQNEDNEKEWFIEIGNKSGFILVDKGRALSICSKLTTNMIFDSFKIKRPIVRAYISDKAISADGKKLYQLSFDIK